MIIFSGGTGTPKLIEGFIKLIETKDINVIVNTADDIKISNMYISPDIDTILYLFSNRINKQKWWGIENDTFNTYFELKKYGIKELLMIGDKDRAISIFRDQYLNKGYSLTEVIQIISKILNIKNLVLPMTNSNVTTVITCSICNDGINQFQKLHYQEYLMNPSDKRILSVDLHNISNSKLTKEIIELMDREDIILIGPSNPITSIGPILQIKDMKKYLYSKKVIAVSPIISNCSISGPTNELMKSCSLNPSSVSIIEIYKEFIDVFIYDESDYLINEEIIKNYSTEFKIKFIKANIIMNTIEDKIKLSKIILEEINKLRNNI